MEKELNRLKEMLEDELGKITKKGDITPAELENATKAVCLIEKIRELEGSMDNEHSEGYSNARYPRMHYGGDFDEYSGYNHSRSPHTGRYVVRGSYGDYSGHSINDRMVAKLEEMYDEAKTDHERETVETWIRRLRSDK